MQETLRIETLGTSGDGIARRADGAAVFVPLAAPGDAVRVDVRKDHEGFWRGQVKEIVTPGPARVKAPCAHYGTCGGCHLQHIDEATYRDFKKDVVVQALRKAGIAAEHIEPPVFIPPGTRRRATMSAFHTGREIVIGFNERRSDRVTAVPSCLILRPELRTVIDTIKPFLKDILPHRKTVDITLQIVEGQVDVGLTGRLSMNLAAQETFAAMANAARLSRVSLRERARDTFEPILSLSPVIKNFGNVRVNLPPGAFLQASDEAETVMTDWVVSASQGAKNILDLFCGCGTFAGALSGFAKVQGVDLDEPSTRALSAAGVRAKMRNLYTEPMTPGELNGFDAVILDPPRAGAMAQVRELAESDVPRVIYVSCNPTTFAKDAKVLIDGGYRLTRVQPVDQFVWSVHTEVMGIFSRNPD